MGWSKSGKVYGFKSFLLLEEGPVFPRGYSDLSAWKFLQLPCEAFGCCQSGWPIPDYFWLCWVLCSEFDQKIPVRCVEEVCVFHTDLLDFPCCGWEKQCQRTGISLLLRHYTYKEYYEAFQWLCVVCHPKGAIWRWVTCWCRTAKPVVSSAQISLPFLCSLGLFPRLHYPFWKKIGLPSLMGGFFLKKVMLKHKCTGELKSEALRLLSVLSENKSVE